jgi:Na+-driven multidrug efflux pump
VVLVSGALAYLFVRVLSMGLESVWLALALGAAITSTISFVWLRWRIRCLERRQ